MSSSDVDEVIALANDSPRRLTAVQFQGLENVPAEAEWFANIASAATRRAYRNALADFIRFTGIARPAA